MALGQYAPHPFDPGCACSTCRPGQHGLKRNSAAPVVGPDGRIPAKPVRHLNRDTGKWIDMRSTLEGKWAVFFDYLNIKWIYEPDRYSISDEIGETQTTYLPDFWLPEHEVWVEVKGKATERDLELLALAANPCSGLPRSDIGHGPRIVMLGQIPKVNYGWMVWQHVLSWESTTSWDPGPITQMFSFERDKLFGRWSEVWSDPAVGVWHSDQRPNLEQHSMWNFDAYVDPEPYYLGDGAQFVVVEAYQAARRATFMPASQPNGSGK